jgi:type I restriction enzyme M protein
MMQIEIKNNKIRVPLKGKDEWLVLKPEEQVRQE